MVTRYLPPLLSLGVTLTARKVECLCSWRVVSADLLHSIASPSSTSNRRAQILLRGREPLHSFFFSVVPNEAIFEPILRVKEPVIVLPRKLMLQRFVKPIIFIISSRIIPVKVDMPSLLQTPHDSLNHTTQSAPFYINLSALGALGSNASRLGGSNIVSRYSAFTLRYHERDLLGSQLL